MTAVAPQTTTIDAPPQPIRRTRPPAARRLIKCPECGDVRDVSARHARRIAAGEHSMLCDWCRSGGPDINITEELLVFWLVWAGRHIPEGGCPRAYVRVYGVPTIICRAGAEINSILGV